MTINIKKEFRKNRPVVLDNYGKIPPQAVEAEEAVIGAMMWEADKLQTALEIIPSEECFYDDGHQKIFKAIKQVFDSGYPATLITVSEQLRKTGELEIVGGAYKLTKIINATATTAMTEAHCRIVMEKHIARELIKISGRTTSDAYGNEEDVFDILDIAQQKLEDLSSFGIKKDFEHISKVSNKTIADILEKRERGITFSGINTGFKGLNDLTGGWQKSDLIIKAARPAVGKTSASISFALASAQDLDHGGPVGIFNLEMSTRQLFDRMLANYSGIPLDYIKKPWLLTNDQVKYLQDCAIRLDKLPIHIDDSAGLNIMEFKSKARRMVSKYGCQLIIVDYIQLVEVDSLKHEIREQQVSKISRTLKKTAKELHIPIIALSQLNRGVETRANNQPTLGDLRESGAIEQDADLVMLSYKATKEAIEKNPELAGIVHTDLAKNRNGSTGELMFESQNHIQRWKEIEQQNSFTRFNPEMSTRQYTDYSIPRNDNIF